METGKSGFRKLLEISDKAAKEVLGEFYIVSESRMENYLQIMESGAEQIKSQEKELNQLQADLAAERERVEALEEALKRISKHENLVLFSNRDGVPTISEFAKKALSRAAKEDK